MNALLLDEAAKERAHEIALFAARPENWVHIDPQRGPSFVAGDRPEHVHQFQSYRCVFSYTEAKGALYRQLSLSSWGALAGKYPHPFIVATVATWFGFTGGVVEHDVTVQPAPDWILQLNDHPVAHAVVVQEIGPTDHALVAARGGSA